MRAVEPHATNRATIEKSSIMFKKRPSHITLNHRPDWRSYQTDLNRSVSRKRLFTGAFKTVCIGVFLAAVLFGVLGGFGGAACHHSDKGAADSEVGAAFPEKSREKLTKHRIQSLLRGKKIINLEQSAFDVVSKERRLHVQTSLDMSLQNFLMGYLNTATSRYIGIVVMEPSTGRVLAMVGYDKTDSSGNPCVDSHFPAASVFKIVTAAAAIETKDYTSDTPLTYNGRKHTLYKSQLKDKRNKWTRKTTLRRSFAESVNPVFGKIGLLVLGKSPLEAYAQAFGFNDEIAFEVPVGTSTAILSEDPYQWAEVASGFNRSTRISPLHGAMIASAIINRGRLFEPAVIDRVTDVDGNILYEGEAHLIRQAMQPEGTQVMNRLMAETVKSGTGRKTFRGYKKDKVLSRLNIGGKTGSINNAAHDVRYDWFVGFAEDKKGSGKIVVSTLVAHEKYIGTRAAQYAKAAMKQFFKRHFAAARQQDAES